MGGCDAKGGTVGAPGWGLARRWRPSIRQITWIAEHADAGDVIPGADGARKVRWKRAGSGKSGGVRVIYFSLTDEEAVLRVAVYAKAEQDNMLPKDIRKVV